MTGVFQFLRLWGVLFGIVLAIAGAEAFVIWQSGFRFKPAEEVHQIWFEDLSFQRRSRFAAAVIGHRRNAMSAGAMSDVVLVNMRTQDVSVLALNHLRPVAVALSPDATAIVVVGVDGMFRWVTDYLPATGTDATAKIKTIFDDKMFDVARLLFSPDGKKLAAINDRFVCVWDLIEGRKLYQHRHHGAKIRSANKVLAFTEDSREIIATGETGGISVRDIRSGAIRQRIDTNDFDIFDIAVFEKGGCLAVATNGPRPEVAVYPLGAQGNDVDESRWLTIASAPLVSIGENGQWVASVDFRDERQRVCVLDIETGEERCVLPGHRQKILGLASAGQVLYSWDSTGLVCEWDIVSGQRTSSFSMLEWGWMLDAKEQSRHVQFENVQD